MSPRLLVKAALAVPVLAGVVLAAEVQMARTGPNLPAAEPLSLDRAAPGGEKVWWLGDSTAAGVGASAADASLPRLVSGDTDLRVIARSGARVDDVLRDQVPKVPADADTVFVSVGANDAVHLTGQGTFRSRYAQVLDGLPEGARVVVLGVPDMGAIPRFAQPLRAIVGWRGRRLDDAVRASAREVGALYVDIADATGPAFRRDPDRNFADDLYHPSDRGYRLWAAAVNEVSPRRGTPARGG